MAKKVKVGEEPIVHEHLVCPKCESTHVAKEGDKCVCRDCRKKW